MAEEEKREKSDREIAMEHLADRIINWASGDDDGFGPGRRMLVWIKFFVKGVFYFGILIPFFAMIAGITISRFGNDTALSIAQWIMMGSIIVFGIPALAIAGIGGGLVASLIKKLIFPNTSQDLIQFAVYQYFNVLIWTLFVTELVIIFGVTAPLKVILFGLVATIAVVIAFIFWDKGLGVGRAIIFWSNVGLLVWVLGVSMPSGVSLRLFGYDVRSEWSFRSASPLTINQWELDKLENELAKKVGTNVRGEIDAIKKEIENGNTAAATQLLENLKRPYADRPVIPETTKKVWNKGKEVVEKFDSKN